MEVNGFTFSDEQLEDYLSFAKGIALKAGEINEKYFNKDNKGIDYKVDRTIVTLADKEINSYLIEKAREKYPDIAIDGEEEKYGDSKIKWICDPVDGTAMFARNIPVSVFSLGLVVDGKPILGVVYDSFTKSMYSAIIGKGAYLNDQRISVNDYNYDDKEGVGNFDMWPTAEFDVTKFLSEVCRREYFVGIGSVIRASMCVASGKFNVAIFPGTINKYCDMAAAKVIVEEAGGIVRNFYGEEQRYDEQLKGAIISNKVVYEETLNIIKEKVLNK